MLRLLKKKIIKDNIPGILKLLLWAVSCVLWNGSFRVHEILSRTVSEFDPQTTLLWEDIKFRNVKLEGVMIEAVSFKVKSPKVDRIGAGDFIEVYATGEYNCPVKALGKWREANFLTENPKFPVFRTSEDQCFTGKQLNQHLSRLTECLSEHMKGGKVTSHSYRAGIASEMCRAGKPNQTKPNS